MTVFFILTVTVTVSCWKVNIFLVMQFLATSKYVWASTRLAANTARCRLQFTAVFDSSLFSLRRGYYLPPFSVCVIFDQLSFSISCHIIFSKQKLCKELVRRDFKTLGQWFPTFQQPWTLRFVILNAVTPFKKIIKNIFNIFRNISLD